MERAGRRLPSRRSLLAGAAALGGAALAGDRARAENPTNLPPNVPPWTRQLGDGVATRPYGDPVAIRAARGAP